MNVHELLMFLNMSFVGIAFEAVSLRSGQKVESCIYDPRDFGGHVYDILRI